MDAEAIRIDELRLRVPGLSEAEAQEVGREIARRIADGLPPRYREEHLGLLDLKISMPFGIPKERLAEQIAAQILEKLR